MAPSAAGSGKQGAGQSASSSSSATIVPQGNSTNGGTQNGNGYTNAAGPSTAASNAQTAGTATPAAVTAPLIEPPRVFGLVAPGVYRCSASSLADGLPAPPRGWQAPKRYAGTNSKQQGQPASSAGGTNILAQDHARRTPSPSPSARMLSGSPSAPGTNIAAGAGNGNSGANAGLGVASATSNIATTPTEAFLASLQLRTVLLLTPERRPLPLAVWCAQNNVDLVHLGLGALADAPSAFGPEQQPGRAGVQKNGKGKSGADTSTSASDAQLAIEVNEIGFIDAHVPSQSALSWQAMSESHPARMVSIERIVKDSLEVILDGSRLPCLVCDMTGVNETSVVVGCLRRMQRFNFASIRREYHAYAANRARSSHERFIEMFDTDLVTLPPISQMPLWYAQMLADDAADEATATEGRP